MRKTLVILMVAVLLPGCSPGFVMRAAYEQSKILLRREKIDTILAQKKEDEETRRKLALVLETRKFAKSIGLNPGGSFKSYSPVKGEALVWVVAGSKPTKFDLYTWWFPIVGSVPYKGFFEKKDAEQQAKELEALGYETSVRGADALSTLGWFDDPVLTTLIRHQDDWISNTVIHESLHSTVWIPDNVPFNETLANFVGFQGSINFFEHSHNESNLKIAQKRLRMEMGLGDVISALYDDLNSLYEGGAPEEIKLKYREQIFEKHISPLRKKFPDLRALSKINNAELVQLKFYLTKFDRFRKLYETKGASWPNFLKAVKAIAQAMKSDKSKDPFQLLEEQIAQH